MADGGDGFVGRCEVVEPLRRGKRRWSTETKARIVAESLQPGARVVDVVLVTTTSPHTTTPKPGKPSATLGAGFSSCHPTLPT